jgi:hypothetical protein
MLSMLKKQLMCEQDMDSNLLYVFHAIALISQVVPKELNDYVEFCTVGVRIFSWTD